MYSDKLFRHANSDLTPRERLLEFAVALMFVIVLVYLV